jgi:hypothetical protein
MERMMDRVERRLEARERFYPPTEPTNVRFVACFKNGPLAGKRWAYNDPIGDEFHYGGMIYYKVAACVNETSTTRELLSFFELPPTPDNIDAELDVIAQQLTGGEEGM